MCCCCPHEVAHVRSFAFKVSMYLLTWRTDPIEEGSVLCCWLLPDFRMLSPWTHSAVPDMFQPRSHRSVTARASVVTPRGTSGVSPFSLSSTSLPTQHRQASDGQSHCCLPSVGLTGITTTGTSLKRKADRVRALEGLCTVLPAGRLVTETA